ncbi:MAG: Wzz/FepE/Etk N-terminal domain-containing protein [Planctomycetota bacterium]
MESNEISIRELAIGVWKRRRLVIITTCVVTFLVGLFTLFAQKSYVSEGSVFVRLGRENATLDVTATLGQAPGTAVPLDRDVEINSIAELMTSREVLDQLVEHFGADVIIEEGLLKADGTSQSSGSFSPIGALKGLLRGIGVLDSMTPHDKAIQTIRSRLYATSVKDTTLIRVGYESYDPEFSRDFLEELIQRYVDYHVKINRPQNAPEFLEQQLKTVGDKLAKQEAELDRLKTSASLYAFDDQRRLLAEQMSNLQTQRDANIADRAAFTSEVESLKQRLSDLPTTKSLSSVTGAGNEGADGMRQQLYQLQLEYQRMLSEKQPGHPDVLRLKGQVDQAEKILSQEEQRRTQTVEGPNQIYESIRTDLIRKESALAAVITKLKTLDSTINRLSQRLDTFIKNERDYRRLEREILVNETTYQNYSSNLEQARIDRELEQKNLSNLSISEHAALNMTPASPNKKLNMAAGLVFGLLLGGCIAILQELLAPRQEDGGWVSPSTISLPVIARIPQLEMLPEPQES